MSERSFQLYDTTLRDSSQQEGMVLTVDGKLAVSKLITLHLSWIPAIGVIPVRCLKATDAVRQGSIRPTRMA